MPDWLPFIILALAGTGLGTLFLLEFKRVADGEWSEEREATDRLKVIHGDGAEVHPFMRRGA